MKKEEGSSTEFRNCVSKKGDVIIARVSAIKNILTVLAVAITLGKSRLDKSDNFSVEKLEEATKKGFGTGI